MQWRIRPVLIGVVLLLVGGALAPLTASETLAGVPPRLAVSAPAEGAVARPRIHLAAACAPAGPGECTSITASIAGDVPHQVASGTSTIDTDVSLADRDGAEITLVFKAVDGAGQVTSRQVPIFVESSPVLREVASVSAGTILAWNPDRLLFIHTAGDGTRRLSVRERVSGVETAIPNPPGKQPVGVNTASLVPGGVLFIAKAANALDTAVFEWRSGVVRQVSGLLNSADSLRLSGRYALWSGEAGNTFTATTDLFLRDLIAGTTTRIAPQVGNVYDDVARNGNVVYWGQDYQIYRFRDGVITRLSDGSARFWNVYPVTDGGTVVYRRQTPCCTNQTYALLVNGPTGATTLAPPRPQEPIPFMDYQVASGWIAYTRPSAQGVLQVWVRSPDGTERQASTFAMDSRMESPALDRSTLGDHGEVVFISSGRRYLSTGRSDAVRVASNLGQSSQANGEWFVNIGRTLYQVTLPTDTTPPITSAVGSPQSNASGWNSRDVDVRLTLRDQPGGSGAREITYSASGAQPIPSKRVIGDTATIHLTAEGVTRLTYSGVDEAGNQEQLKELIVRIDKTAPEAFTRFDPTQRTLRVFGKDAGSGVSHGPIAPIPAKSVNGARWTPADDVDGSTIADDGPAELQTYTITDLAGNATTLVMKVKPPERNDDQLKARLVSVQNGTAPIVVLGRNSQEFDWEVSSDGSLAGLDQWLRIGEGRDRRVVEARFDGPTNATDIMVQSPRRQPIMHEIGLILPRMETVSGELSIDF